MSVCRKIFIPPVEIGVGVERGILASFLRIVSLMLSLSLVVVGLSLVVVSPVSAKEDVVWEGDVYSSGVPVSSPGLAAGTTYRIVASEIWFYDNFSFLAADAQYYTTSSVSTWDWVNHFTVGNHSFLQINGQDVNWGPYQTGEMLHIYSIYYTGQGAAIVLRIFDWVDQNTGNNFCHNHVVIYEELTVGGRVVDSGRPDAVALWTVGAVLVVSLVAVPVMIRVRKME